MIIIKLSIFAILLTFTTAVCLLAGKQDSEEQNA